MGRDRRPTTRRAQLALGLLLLVAFVLAGTASAFATVTFSNGSPANGYIFGDPDVSPTATVRVHVDAYVDAAHSFPSAPNPSYAAVQVSVDGAAFAFDGMTYGTTGNWDWSIDDWEKDYSHGVYDKDLTLTTNQQHTIVLRVTEQPGGATYDYTWVVGKAVAPENCSSCHNTYPAEHPMGACASCHYAGGPVTYHNGGFNRCGSECHHIASHGPELLGQHTYTDLDGNQSIHAATSCGYCHDETRFPAVPSHGDVAGTKWSYKDLSDSNAKYEGGYDCVTCHENQPDFSPHGGYDTATNKCKVCHAVHRAEGAYYLLRADSQDDACEYCHLGSAHSAIIVYDNGGTGTANGHTIGASTYIPDSTVAQWTVDTTLKTTDETGAEITEVIKVRAYDEQKNDMYRFARHHGHSLATGGARRNYVPVGPLALRCMNCHQVHNATYQTWQTLKDVDAAGDYTSTATGSYKLLKQSPSGSFYGAEDSYGQIPLTHISMVPETTLTAGFNFESTRAHGANPSTLGNSAGTKISRTVAGVTASMQMASPVWVAQNFDGEHDRNAAGVEASIASAVNNYALSVWCADCHNLNIGGWKKLTSEELGFKSHSERTHPAPYTGAHGGPGQCYSCHRADLPRINAGDTCSQCHYGTGNYMENRRDPAGAEYVASDFPHSGDGSYKMLGNYSIAVPTGGQGTDSQRTTLTTVTVGANNVDAVCLRCHGGIGTHH